MRKWFKEMFCGHLPEDLTLVVIGGSVTVENVIVKCGHCGKLIGKPKLEV